MNILVYPIAGVISGLFSAMAGSEKFPKIWRRLGSTVCLVTGFVFLSHFDVKALMAFAYALPLSMGYGVPSPDDKGSAIGEFWFKVTGMAYWTDIFTRVTLGIVKCLVLLPVALSFGNFKGWLVSFPLVVFLNFLFGGNSFIREGQFSLFGTRMNWEEFIIVGGEVILFLIFYV